MRINSNTNAFMALNQLSKRTSNIASVVEKLSSGRRINKAADDAAGLAISEKMRSQIRGFDVALSNVQNAASMTQTLDGALSNTSQALQRMNELAVKSSSDTYTDEDRSKFQLEFDQLRSEIDTIATSTTFNKKQIATASDGGGTSTGKANSSERIQVGPNSDQTMSLSFKLFDADSLGLGSVSVSTAEEARQAISSIANSINTLSSERGSVGAIQNALTNKMSSLMSSSEAASATFSQILDVDMAKESTTLTSELIMQQVATAMLAQANAQPEHILELIKSQ